MMSLCVKCIQAISTVWHVHQSLATVKRDFTGTDVMLIIFIEFNTTDLNLK